MEKSFFSFLLRQADQIIIGPIGNSAKLLLPPLVEHFIYQLPFMERVKINLEFIFRASPSILYQFFTTPSCLIRWFCDEVDITDNTYTFSWSGSEEVAEVIDEIEDELIRFQWEDAEDDEFLEFHISKSPVTSETILALVDFCDEDEVSDQTQYWESLMDKLRVETGG